MSQNLIFNGKNFISAKRARELTGYSTDYIGQLSRQKKIEAKLIGRTWYVSESSLQDYQKTYANKQGGHQKNEQASEAAPKLSVPYEKDNSYIKKELLRKDISPERDEPLFKYYSESGDVLPIVKLAPIYPTLKNDFYDKVSKNEESILKQDFKDAGKVSPLNYLHSSFLQKGAALFLSIAIVISSSFIYDQETLKAFAEKGKSFVSNVLPLNGNIGLEKIGNYLTYINHSKNNLTASVKETQDGFFSIITRGLNGISNYFVSLFKSDNTEENNLNIEKSENIAVQKIEEVVPPKNTIELTQISLPVENKIEIPQFIQPVERVTKPAVTSLVTTASPPTIIREIVGGGVSDADVDVKIQQLSNKLMSEITKYSSSLTGQYNSAPSFYTVASAANRIDQLTNTVINTPIISGGSISGATISGGTLGGTFSGTISSSTFSGTTTSSSGFDITGGCFSVNSVCVSSGGGITGSGVSGQAAFFTGAGTIGSDGGFVWDNVNKRLGIGTTSPYSSLSVVGTTTAAVFEATTTATSTFAGGIQSAALNITGGATSTFANGISISSGCFLINGTCFTGSGGSGTPGGANTQIQFNNSGSFAGDSGLTFNSTTDLLTVTSFLSTFATTTNFLATGSSTLQNFTALNSTTTQSTSTNLFATSLNGTNGLISSLLTAGNILATGSTTLQNFTGLQSTTTQSTSTNLFATSLNGTNGFITSLLTSGNILATGSSTLQNFTALNSTTTNATSTSLFASIGTFTNSFVTSLATVGNLLSTGSSTLQNFTSLNSTTTQSTSTNLFATTLNGTNSFISALLTAGNILATGSTTLQNFTAINSTSTNATTTNFFATNASSTNLFATAINSGNITSTGVGTFSGLTLNGFNCTSFSNGGKLTTDGSGNVSCANDISGSGGGGSDVNWTFFNGSGISVSTTSNQVVIGASATSSLARLEVNAANAFLVTGSSTLQNFTALNSTTTNATSTSIFAAVGAFTNSFVNSLATVGNLLSTGSSTLQNFTALNSTTTNATSTSLSVGTLTVSGIATSTFGGGISTSRLDTSATSTFAGLRISSQGLAISTIISCTEALETDSNGNIICGTDQAGGSGGANSKFATTTSTAFPNAIHVNGGNNTLLGIGTTTPAWMLQVASSTGAQLALSDASLTSNHWTFRNAGGNLYIATGSPSTFGTSTMPALTINTNGFVGIGSSTPNERLSVNGNLFVSGNATTTGDLNVGTTLTVRGSATSTFTAGLNTSAINVTGSATSTFANGANISEGCFAKNGACVNSLSSLTNATAANTISNSNFLQTWNWQLTGANENGLLLTENTASTNGVDQSILRINTLSGSTARPLSVLAQGVSILGVGQNGDIAISSRQNQNVTIFGGTGIAGAGGVITIRSGTGSTNAAGATTVISGGHGGSSSGASAGLTMQAGTPVDGDGGSHTLTAGTGVGTNRNGGSVTINAGGATGTGLPGNIILGNTFGSVGIGTTTPNWTLQVASATPYFAITDNDAGTDAKHWLISAVNGIFRIGTSTDLLNSTSTYLTISSAGTTTLAGLSISGGASTTASAGFNISSGCYAVNNSCVGAGTTPTGGTGAVQFNSAGSFAGDGNNFFWDNSKKTLGIGTTTPEWQLQIASSTRPQLALTDPNGPTDGKHWVFRSVGGNLYVGTSSDALTSTSTYLTINNNGYVGIGTTSPFAQLSVQGAAANTGAAATAFAVYGGAGNATFTGGGGMNFVTGNASGAGSGGLFSVTGGLGGTTGVGGAITLTGGSGGSSSGAGGAVTITSGSPVGSSASGVVTISSGNTGGTTAPGLVTITGGNNTAGAASGGQLLLSGGASTGGGSGSTVTLSGGTAAGVGGTLAISSGAGGSGGAGGPLTITGGVGSTDAAGGAITISGGAGDGIGAAGQLNLNGGSGGSTNVNGGDVRLNGGVAGGTGQPGNVILSNSRGNTGIGTTTPRFSLQIASSTRPQLALSDGSLTSNHWTFRNAGGNLYLSTSSPLTFATSTYTALTINNNGFVGIGSTSPTSAFSVTGISNFGGDINLDQYSVIKMNTSRVLMSTSSMFNLFVGSGAGQNIIATSTVDGTSGIRNTALGINALTNATSSDFNVAIGNGAMGGNSSDSSGSSNVAIGFSSLTANSSGANNTAVGAQTMVANTTGVQNVAFGAGSLDVNTTASNNTAIGFAALGASVTGASNVALGSSASGGNTSATNTTAIGFAAGSGSSNFNAEGYTVLGYLAGDNISTGSDYSTFLGYQSGSAVTSGFGNILIGPSVTANNLTTGAGNIGIGYNTFFPSATANRQLNIGGLIFGSLPATSTSLVTNPSGTIGIGTTTPNWTLQVASATPYFAITDNDAPTNAKHWLLSNIGGVFNIGTSSDALNATSSYLTVRGDTGGQVGIGTTSPWRTLSVTGTVAFSGLSAEATGDTALCLSSGGEVRVSAGTSCTLSSAQYKENINSYDGGINTIRELNPKVFNYKGLVGERIGFIAEEVDLIDPRLVVRNKNGGIETVRYEEMTAVLAKAVQEIDLRLLALEAASTTLANTSSIFSAQILIDTLQQFGIFVTDALVQIKNLTVEKLTVGSSEKPSGITLFDEETNEPYCLTISGGAIKTTSGECQSSSETIVYEAPPVGNADGEVPVITLLGNNPAIISVGSTYVDLGATVTDNVDQNLGYQINPESIDTSTTTTYTVLFTATDSAGNVGTTSRGVIVE